MKLFYIFLIALSFISHPALSEDVIYQDAEYKASLPKKEKPAAAPKNKTIEKKTVDYNSTDSEAPNIHPIVRISSGALKESPQVKTDCDYDGTICLYSYAYPEEIVIEAENKTPSARTIIMDYTLNNMQAANNSSRKNIVLRSGERKKIETLYPLDTTRDYGYNYTYKSYFGIIDATHDDAYEYDLPFELGQKWMLLQGIGGKFSHSDEENYYAYDFKMPTGTAVLAARDGIVVKIVGSYTEGGVNTSLKKKSNYIYVQHSDGTVASYAHIKHKGALANVGDKVQKGQKIALSGNTGYTTNPHLHFGVFKVIRGGKFKSIDVKIKTKKGILPRLTAGDFYEK